MLMNTASRSEMRSRLIISANSGNWSTGPTGTINVGRRPVWTASQMTSRISLAMACARVVASSTIRTITGWPDPSSSALTLRYSGNRPIIPDVIADCQVPRNLAVTDRDAFTNRTR